MSPDGSIKSKGRGSGRVLRGTRVGQRMCE